MIITQFRNPDAKTVHAASSMKPIKRNRGHKAFCGAVFDAASQRLPSHEPHKAVPTTCPIDLAAIVALNDITDTDFGFSGGGTIKRISS